MTVRLSETERIPLAAGIDIGGSKVLAVALDERRMELGRDRRAPRRRSPARVRARP